MFYQLREEEDGDEDEDEGKVKIEPTINLGSSDSTVFILSFPHLSPQIQSCLIRSFIYLDSSR